MRSTARFHKLKNHVGGTVYLNKDTCANLPTWVHSTVLVAEVSGKKLILCALDEVGE
jgi:hypothetical protein